MSDEPIRIDSKSWTGAGQPSRRIPAPAERWPTITAGFRTLMCAAMFLWTLRILLDAVQTGRLPGMRFLKPVSIAHDPDWFVIRFVLIFMASALFAYMTIMLAREFRRNLALRRLRKRR